MNYNDLHRLDDKVAFVTGSGRGIGLEISRALGQAGAIVITSDVDATASDEAARALKQEGLRACSMPLDVTASGSVERVSNDVVARFGRVDVLVNNAGIGFQTKVVDMSDDEWRRALLVNTDAVFFCSRAFGRHMIRAKNGAVVNVGSMSGLIVNKPFSAAHYMTSKAAVHQLTKALAVEWAEHNVRVNAVAPGSTVTDQTLPIRENKELFDATIALTPMKRFAEPREIASAVLFLAGEAASYCTGCILSVDGGYTCW